MFCRKTLLGAVVCLVGLGFGPQVRESQSEEPNRISFAALSQDEVDRFRDSLKNNVPLRSISPKTTQKVDTRTEEVWLGSQTNVVTDINEVTLRFRPNTDDLLARSVTSENSRDALLGNVDLAFKLEYPKILFTHSHPLDPKEGAGFKATIDQRSTQTRVKMIDGQRESAMYVAIPPFQDPATMWGAYICPRSIRIETRGPKRGIHLGRSVYSLAEVKGVPYGSCSANLDGGRGKARAAITLQLSSELPESQTSFDQSISSVAEPRVHYQPKSPFDFFRFAPFRSVQQGLNFVVEFQNRLGHVRRQNFSHVLSVYKSDEPSPVVATLRGQMAVQDSGDCYIVQVQRYSWSEYATAPPQL